jgi:sugar phosphate isomerase/epimerase
MDLLRLSISQITTNNYGFIECVKLYSKHGIKNIGIWRDKIEHLKPGEIKDVLNSYDMKATNLCFAGLFTGETTEKRKHSIEDTKKHLEIAKEIGAEFLLIVAGPITGNSIRQSMKYVRRAMDALVPYAEKIGIKMALEAIHPVDIGRWSVITTLNQALSVIKEYDSPNLGLLLDLYNSWWEPDICENIKKADNKILGVHIADWEVPTLTVDSRVLPGQGIIPLRDLIGHIESVGYQGCYDVEIFSKEIWNSNYDDVLRRIIQWFKGLEVGSVVLRC